MSSWQYSEEYVCVLSRVQLFVTPWTVARQAPVSMAFSRQEYWSGLPSPTPRDLPNTGIEPVSPVFCIVGGLFTTEPPGKLAESEEYSIWFDFAGLTAGSYQGFAWQTSWGSVPSYIRLGAKPRYLLQPLSGVTVKD